MIQTIVQLLLSLTILVFVHELGHFLLAKLFKCKVEKFYLFFNPVFSLFKYKSKKTGTEYGLGWLPLGGYCSIKGMIDEKYMDRGEVSFPKHYEFRAKPAWQRFSIMIAGIVMNIILAFIIYTGIALKYGETFLPSDRLSLGFEFSRMAQSIGFKNGDIIRDIDGNSNINVLSADFISKIALSKKVKVQRGDSLIDINIPKQFSLDIIKENNPFISLRIPMVIDSVLEKSINNSILLKGDSILGLYDNHNLSYSEITYELSKKPNSSIVLNLVRNGKESNHEVFTDINGKLGIIIKPIDKLYIIDHHSYNFIRAIRVGINKTINTLASYLKSLKLLFSKDGANQIGGLGSMGKLFSGGFNWFNFWSRTAFLSIIFAVMNFLPIPVLDGGHIIFILIEIISKRSINPKILIKFQQIGIILLLSLMIYANLNDVHRFILK